MTAGLSFDRTPYAERVAVGDHLVDVIPTVWRGAQLCTWDELRTGYVDLYTYEDPDLALVALSAWLLEDGAGEPKGWIRHQPSNRRRPDGDEEREVIRP